MTTYNVRCRNHSCRHRRISKIHPDQYYRPPKCSCCGSNKGWKLEGQYEKREICNCGGPVGHVSGYAYPHRKAGHLFCVHHPEGIYNQAKRQGIADCDIPAEYLPERLKNHE